MNKKQDIPYPRTAADLERKYLKQLASISTMEEILQKLVADVQELKTKVDELSSQ